MEFQIADGYVRIFEGPRIVWKHEIVDRETVVRASFESINQAINIAGALALGIQCNIVRYYPNQTEPRLIGFYNDSGAVIALSDKPFKPRIFCLTLKVFSAVYYDIISLNVYQEIEILQFLSSQA